MKLVVVVLGILGALAGAGLGLKWIGDADAHGDTIRQLEGYQKQLNAGGTTQASANLKGKLDDLNSLVRAAYLMVIGGVGAIVVAVMLLMGKIDSKVAGGVLIGCALVPALLAPKSLVFTVLMIIAGGLCFRLKRVENNPAPEAA